MIDPQQYLEHTLQLPAQASTSSLHVDELYYRIYWLSVVMFVGIIAAMVYFAWKYRKRPGHKAEPTGHNLPLEIGWTIAPLFILVALFHWGFKGYMDLSIPPVDAEEVRVRAFQWGWDFEYKNGATDDKLHIPIGRPIKFIVSSNDVLHAFYIPEMRTKRDAVPGMYASVWVEATKAGKYVLTCAEYCGGKSKDQNGNELDPSQFKGHWSMQSDVIVESIDEYEKYLDGLMGNKPPEQVGKDLWAKKQCSGCHTIDGSKGVAPTWKGIWGREETMNDGKKVKVDENYVRESVLDPNAKIVQGYASPSVMPSFKGTLKDRDIDAIIAFMKTLKE
jgi:cytochrome c oxidase subunit 2